MVTNEPNLDEKWERSTNHLELQKQRLLQQPVKRPKRGSLGRNPKFHPNTQNHLSQKNNPNQAQRKKLSKRANQLFATNVVNLVIEPSNAKLNKRLMNSFQVIQT